MDLTVHHANILAKVVMDTIHTVKAVKLLNLDYQQQIADAKMVITKRGLNVHNVILTVSNVKIALQIVLNAQKDGS